MSDPATPVLEPETDTRPKVLPPYHVIIENDDDHTQLFVVMVLRKVFGYDDTKAVELMLTAHETGEAIVWTGPKEVAELKYDQIRSFHETRPGDGAQLGPVGCTVEPAPGG